MSSSNHSPTPSIDTDISTSKRLEFKIVAEEQALNPDFSESAGPQCMAGCTKHVHFREDGHDDVIEDRDYEADAEQCGRSSTESTRSDVGSNRQRLLSRLPKRIGRRSFHDGEEKVSFHGAFR